MFYRIIKRPNICSLTFCLNVASTASRSTTEIWLRLPCEPPPTCRWLCTCGRRLSTRRPPWSGTQPPTAWTQPPTPAGKHSCYHVLAVRRVPVTVSPHEDSCASNFGSCFLRTLARCKCVSVSRSGWCLATRRITSSNIRFFLYMVMARSGCFTAEKSLKRTENRWLYEFTQRDSFLLVQH